MATGSPFDPVSYDGTSYVIAQANNALIFPGLGLGTIVSRATHISDGMLGAAAHAVAGFVDRVSPSTSILPPVESLREVSAAVATGVVEAAVAEGLARASLSAISRQVRAAMWQPIYCQVDPG